MSLLSVLVACPLIFVAPALADQVSGIVELCLGCDGICGVSHTLYDPCSMTAGPIPLDGNQLLGEADCAHFDLSVGQCFSTTNPWYLAFQASETTVQCTYIRGFRVTGSTDATLVMPRGVRCAGSFDVIRGELPLVQGGSLGDVTCLANDWQGPSLLPESSTPSLGQVLFYLVRANGRPYGPHYGLASDGAPRLPLAGDCPP